MQRPEVISRFTTGQSATEALNFSYTTSAYWLRLTLRNSSDESIDRLLEVGKSRLSSVELHQVKVDGTVKSVITGDVLSFDTRPYRNRFFVFPLSLPPHSEQVLYLRIQSESSIVIPARLWMPEAFHVYERSDYIVQALYFGMAAGLILFNLLLFIAIRDVIYLYYAFFSTSMVYTLAAQNGLLKEFLDFDAPLFWRVSLVLGYALALASFLAFMRRMLRTPETIPRVDPWLKGFIVVHLLSPVVFSTSVVTTAQPLQLLYVVTLLLIMSAGVDCARQRQRSAYFFVAAYLILFVAGVVTSLTGLGLLPVNYMTMNSLQFGSAMEMLLLAFALADRFIVMRREKEQAQQKLVETLKTSERNLEERVEQRTLELQASIAKLGSTLHDLQATQLKLVASERKAMQGEQKAKQALAEQRQFIAMVSHEFRSPLAVIDAASQFLSKRLSSDETTAPVLSRIRRGISRLTNFLENCLTEDRLASENLGLNVSSIDLPALVATVVESAQLISERHPVETELAPDLPLLTADPQLMRILLLNLLSNAIKYSPLGHSVRLVVRQVDGGCCFEVIDQGQGIAAEELPRVFEKYWRGRGASSTPGAGLGMSLVARIVNLHRGRIDIDSHEGCGTRVTVTLPA